MHAYIITSYFITVCRSCVRVVTSTRAGMGKSLYIKRRREALAEITTDCESCLHLIIPLHGPLVTADSVIEALKEYIGHNKAIIFHLDIASNVGNLIYNKVFIFTKNLNKIIFICRYCGRLMLFCSACWYFMASVIAREEYGAANQHTST